MHTRPPIKITQTDIHIVHGNSIISHDQYGPLFDLKKKIQAMELECSNYLAQSVGDASHTFFATKTLTQETLDKFNDATNTLNMKSVSSTFLYGDTIPSERDRKIEAAYFFPIIIGTLQFNIHYTQLNLLIDAITAEQLTYNDTARLKKIYEVAEIFALIKKLYRVCEDPQFINNSTTFYSAYDALKNRLETGLIRNTINLPRNKDKTPEQTNGGKLLTELDVLMKETLFLYNNFIPAKTEDLVKTLFITQITLLSEIMLAHLAKKSHSQRTENKKNKLNELINIFKNPNPLENNAMRIEKAIELIKDVTWRNILLKHGNPYTAGMFATPQSDNLIQKFDAQVEKYKKHIGSFAKIKAPTP